MPNRPPRVCSEPGCGQPANGRFCPTHEKKNHTHAYDAQRAEDPIRQRYNSTAWRRFTVLIKAHNPICQRIEYNPLTGKEEQCREPASEVHHLVSPRERPDLFTVASNVVAICKRHHHKGEGEPGGARGQKYAPTKSGYAMTGGVSDAN